MIFRIATVVFVFVCLASASAQNSTWDKMKDLSKKPGGLLDATKKSKKKIPAKKDTSTAGTSQTKKSPSGGSPLGYSEFDAASAIKEVLIGGTTNATSIVSQLDGYFLNPEIKIPFPPEAARVESTLRKVGMNKQADDVVLSINRAAEDAAKEAAPIFVDAVKKMTLKDAIGIVNGPSTSATQYLSNSTTPALATKFNPIVKNSLDKVNATKYWKDAITAYNALPLVKKVNPDLSAYVTERAISGLFIMIGKEEANIRANPSGWGSSIIDKVFGKK